MPGRVGGGEARAALATALDLRLDGLLLVTCDERQARAGRAAGLKVAAPQADG